MARRNGKAWGNALGGYKKQARAKNGRFGRGVARARSASRNPKVRKAAKVAAVAGVVAVGAYGGRTIARERALSNKHGAAYVPKVGKYSHYTNNNSARKLAKSRDWKPTSKHAGHGAADGVWLTRHKKLGHYDGETRDVFGKARLDVVLTRKQVLGNMTHQIPQGLSKRDANLNHVQIRKDALNGRKLYSNIPRGSKATRERYLAHRAMGDSSYGASRNMGVSPTRRKIKKRTSK